MDDPTPGDVESRRVKIALIGDVHANLPALEAVLSHAKQEGAQTIWNVGDLLGYGAFPDEVVQQLYQEKAMSIVGNYDLKVLKFKRKQDKWRETKHPLKFLAFQWARDHLSKKSRKYLSGLPQEIRLEVGGKRILLTHGSPASGEEPLTPTTSQARLRELARIAMADLILCGHSHQPFARQVENVWFINAGSVGRPDDGDPRPGYAIMDLGSGGVHVCHHRLEYDVERAAGAIRACGLPEAFVQMTLQGCSLDAVLGHWAFSRRTPR